MFKFVYPYLVQLVKYMVKYKKIMKRIVSLLILSGALIVILLSIGDLGEIIDETQKQQNIVDFIAETNTKISC